LWRRKVGSPKVGIDSGVEKQNLEGLFHAIQNELGRERLQVKKTLWNFAEDRRSRKGLKQRRKGGALGWTRHPASFKKMWKGTGPGSEAGSLGDLGEDSTFKKRGRVREKRRSCKGGTENDEEKKRVNRILGEAQSTGKRAGPGGVADKKNTNSLLKHWEGGEKNRKIGQSMCSTNKKIDVSSRKKLEE